MLCCPLQLALGQQGAVLTRVEEISLPTTPMDMRDAFWRKIRKLFLEISSPTTHWRLNPGLAENFWDFLLSLPTGHEKCVWYPIFEFFYPLLFFGDGRCVLTEENHIFIWNFCGPRLHGRNVNPHYPLEVRLAFEQKIRNFLFSLTTGHESAVFSKWNSKFFSILCL